MMKDIVSIEKVLNSRCSSELGPNKSHFGTLINKLPPETVMSQIVDCLKIPTFSEGKLLHWFENGYLFLGFQNSGNPSTQRLHHIESGMQHEAVQLACAAEGVGTCIHNQGINGTKNGERTLTSKHLILEMEEAYDSGKLATKAPGPQKPYVLGKNLNAPVRDGNIECLAELSRLVSFKKSGSSATERDTSQLLWAARGRTPHCIQIQKWSFMWGLTIPTWGGAQNLASVYLLKDGKLHRYINWTKDFSFMNRLFREKLRWTRGNPTHDIRFVRNVQIDSQMDGHEQVILLCQNEHTGRALWEVGYMLENIFLQARSLGISYESKIFAKNETSQLNELGVPGVVASVFI
jgi:hypothetical protein